MDTLIPSGFSFGGARCGLKNKRNDIGLIVSDRPARCAGVFTTNFARAHCVDLSRTVVERGTARAIVVNSGNANACTGEQGIADTARMAELAGQAIGASADEVAVGSTGVIGQLLDMAKVARGIAEASTKLSADPRPFMDAILTTDLVEKWAWSDGASTIAFNAPRADVAHPKAGIFGVAKGSGMIAPNMATMLGYLVTDWDVSELDLAASLRSATDRSFNCMTVDTDTSTNDMLIVLANGASGIRPAPDVLQKALDEVCLSLAKQIARDGEGATKLIEVRVTAPEQAKAIARSIADSPLVKTAMYGCDPNWGRILMAAGKAGVPFQTRNVRLRFLIGDEEFVLFENDGPGAFDPKRVSTALKADSVTIELDLGAGSEATIYTCDLGYGYVRINAEYHT